MCQGVNWGIWGKSAGNFDARGVLGGIFGARGAKGRRLFGLRRRLAQVYAAGYGVGDENRPVFGYQLGHALVVRYRGVYRCRLRVNVLGDGALLG